MSDSKPTPASLIDMEARAQSSSNNKASGSLKQEHYATSCLGSAPAGASSSSSNTPMHPFAQPSASARSGPAASSAKGTAKTRSSSGNLAAQRTGQAAQSRSGTASKPTKKEIERWNRYRESAARMAQRRQKLADERGITVAELEEECLQEARQARARRNPDLDDAAKAERLRVARLFSTLMVQHVLKMGQLSVDCDLEALAADQLELMKQPGWIAETEEVFIMLAIDFLSNLEAIDPDNFHGPSVPVDPAYLSQWIEKKDGPHPDTRPEALRTVREYQHHLVGFLRAARNGNHNRMFNRCNRLLTKHFDEGIKYKVPNCFTERYEAAWASRRATLQAEWDLEDAEQEAVERTSDNAEEDGEAFETKE